MNTMLNDFMQILDGEREPLMFIPPATFGYLFHVTGRDVFLLCSVLSSVFPILIVEGDRVFDIGNITTSGKAITYPAFLLWGWGYPLGIYSLWIYMDHADIILVGFLLVNVLTLISVLLPITFFFKESVK